MERQFLLGGWWCSRSSSASPAPALDRSQCFECLFSCWRPRGDARSAAWEYAQLPGAAAAGPARLLVRRS